jgi:hypothetical protein
VIEQNDDLLGEFADNNADQTNMDDAIHSMEDTEEVALYLE